MGNVLGKLLKWLAYAGAACIMLLALLVGIARLFLPLVPDYQEDIRSWAAAATGFDVQFENISASWPFAGPELRFINVIVSAQENGEEIFFADNLTAGISLVMLIRDRRALLSRLGVEGSRVRMRRDAEGNLLLQDRPVDEFLKLDADADEPLSLPDILITLSDIEVTYADASRSDEDYTFGVDQLEIELSTDEIVFDGDIEFAPEFGGRATVSADLPVRMLSREPDEAESAAGIKTFRDTDEWRIFFDGEDMQIGRLAAYVLNRDVPVSGTQGDITISAAFRDRALHSIAADLDLSDVVLQVDPERIERYKVLSGRVEWSRDGEDGWLAAGTGISVERRDLFAPRSDFSIAVQPAAPDRDGSVKASASFLRLQDLYPFLRVAVNEEILDGVLPDDLELPLDIYGDVQSLEVKLSRTRDAPAKFNVGFQFADAGVVGLGAGNSVRGVSGVLTANQDGGRVQVEGQDSEFEMPAVFLSPIPVQGIAGSIVWRTEAEGVHVLSDNIVIHMPFFDAETRFELDLPGDDRPMVIDLTATAVASDTRRVVSLLPLKRFPPQVAGWLDRAIVAGRLSRGDIRLSGPLNKFPFPEGEGVFQVDIDVEDAVLDYANNWPRIEAIDARVVFDGVSLTSTRNSGRIGGIGFRDGEAHISDLRKGRLEIRGQQAVDVNAGLGFLRQTPVAAAIGPVLGKVVGTGTVNVDLQLIMPVKRLAEYELKIVIDANGADLGMTGLDWGLTEVDGNLTVRNTRFFADDMTAVLLDEPVAINLHPAADSSDLYGQFIRVTGRTPVERWMQALSLPFADRVAGAADWNALVLIPQRQADVRPPVHIVVRSDLVGVASRLPDPLAKGPDDARALEVDIAFPANGKLEVGGGLRNELTWAFELEFGTDAWSIARGAVHGGSAVAIVPAGPGVEVSGRMDFVRFDDWLELTSGNFGGVSEARFAGAGPVPNDWQKTWREAVLQIDSFAAFGQLFRDVQLDARQGDQDWQITVESPAIAGKITVPLNLESGLPVTLDMDRLWLVDSDVDAATDSADDDSVADPRSVPAVDVEVGDFVINDMHFGSLSTVVQSVDSGIIAEPIEMQSPTFSITGDGAWLVHPNDDTLRQTRMALSLNGSDIRSVLSAFGYEPIIEGESVFVSADLTWLGGPSADFLHRAEGTFGVRMKEGSLLAVDPGTGRFLGVLSLAALPRRLSFDFSDVFDDGLSFDTLSGDFTVDDGNAYTCNLSLEGSVADMGIVGRAGFEAEDYDQLAVVRPHVSNLLAVPATVVGGPVAGAAMLLFSQIFRKPLSTLGESYYRVDGSWDDPVVEQIRGNELDISPLRNCEAYLSDAITQSLKEK